MFLSLHNFRIGNVCYLNNIFANDNNVIPKIATPLYICFGSLLPPGSFYPLAC